MRLAYEKVRANKGAAGVDKETIEDYEKDLEGNLYKLWNRMSSGSYFPKAVKRVEIPKSDGGKRALGIPTVTDRIAQMVVKILLEPGMEKQFHKDSYGYRPNKSAQQALGMARRRCWDYDWVVDLDIKGFFDNIDHELMMKAVRKQSQEKWILMYVERWLKTPVQLETGEIIERQKGTPQGGVISPLLANLYLHYALDKWLEKNYPNTPFERYADDSVLHCKTRAEAEKMKVKIQERLKECKLELHPEKTKIVYCKDDDRRGHYENEKFDFLGFTFRARRSKNKYGKYFINFSPAISNKAKKAIGEKLREYKLDQRSDYSLFDIKNIMNPKIQGWINYYGSYYKSALYPVLRHINEILVKWATKKYKKLRRHRKKAENYLGGIANRMPELFAHWKIGIKPTAG